MLRRTGGARSAVLMMSSLSSVTSFDDHAASATSTAVAAARTPDITTSRSPSGRYLRCSCRVQHGARAPVCTAAGEVASIRMVGCRTAQHVHALDPTAVRGTTFERAGGATWTLVTCWEAEATLQLGAHSFSRNASTIFIRRPLPGVRASALAGQAL